MVRERRLSCRGEGPEWLKRLVLGGGLVLKALFLSKGKTTFSSTRQPSPGASLPTSTLLRQQVTAGRGAGGETQDLRGHDWGLRASYTWKSLWL